MNHEGKSGDFGAGEAPGSRLGARAVSVQREDDRVEALGPRTRKLKRKAGSSLAGAPHSHPNPARNLPDRVSADLGLHPLPGPPQARSAARDQVGEEVVEPLNNHTALAVQSLQDVGLGLSSGIYFDRFTLLHCPQPPGKQSPGS